jgi:NAD(P)H-dependent FMN reductase
MNIIAFAASSSSKSINKKLVTYASTLLVNVSVEVIDLNDYELPLFSEDAESEIGKPELANLFLKKIENCDGLIISFAEHNGTYSVAYKNLFDWCSRINPKVYQSKPMVLLSTSPGRGGASNVLASAVNSMPYFGGIVKGSFSLPSFYDNFDSDKNKVSNSEICAQLTVVINKINET